MATTTLQNLLSKIQRAIGDEGFVKIKRAELMDIFEDAVQGVAATVRLWVEQLTITPRNLTETFTVNTANDLPGLVAVQYDTAYVLQESMRYRYYNNAWQIHPYNVIKIDPDITQMYKTLQVWKNGVQCTEQSLQSINAGYSTGYFFSGTNAVKPLTVGTEYAQYRRPDDGTDLVFSKDFESSDTVTIIYRNERPITAKLWVNNVTIPYPVVNAIQYAAIAACQTILYLQGDEAAQAKAVYAADLSSKELASSDAYLRNLLSENSSISVQPLRWLAE